MVNNVNDIRQSRYIIKDRVLGKETLEQIVRNILYIMKPSDINVRAVS